MQDNASQMRWENERQLVLYRLDELKVLLERLAENQQHMNDGINRFRGMASAWGALSGIGMVIISKLVEKFFHF